MRPKTMMIAAKAFFLAMIIYSLLFGQLRDAVFNLAVFIGAFAFTYLGSKNPDYYKIDAASNGLFAFTAVLNATGAVVFIDPVFGFDKVLHFTGGVILAWLGYILLEPHIRNRKLLLVKTVVFVIAVGACWELFEFAFDLMPPLLRVESLGYTDTMLDIVADTLGAVTFVIIASSFKKSKTGKTVKSKNGIKSQRKKKVR